MCDTMAGCDDKYFAGKKTTLSFLEEGEECDEWDLGTAESTSPRGKHVIRDLADVQESRPDLRERVPGKGPAAGAHCRWRAGGLGKAVRDEVKRLQNSCPKQPFPKLR